MAGIFYDLQDWQLINIDRTSLNILSILLSILLILSGPAYFG